MMRGFTLVELVMIIVIIGILAVFALPQLLDMEEFRADAYADEVGAALRYAQKTAIASGCRVQFSVTGADYSILLETAPCNAPAATGYSVSVLNPASGDAFAGTTPDGVTVTPGFASVVFSAVGSASAGGTITIAGGSVNRTVTLVAATGSVAVN